MLKKKFDCVAIGESLRDVFYLISEATVSCSIHKENCLLCLKYADKIPVEHIVKVPAAGNSSNAAVSMARLGLKTALISWVGKDRAGEHVRDALKKEGVNEKYILIDPTRPTSESTIIDYKGEKTQMVYFQPRVYRLPKLPSCRSVYYSAMGETHQRPDIELAKQLKKKPDIFFAFQPGTTHIRSGLKPLLPLIERSDLFILNKDEAHELIADGNSPTLTLMQQFRHIGAKTVVITDGPNGAEAFDGKAHWFMPIFPGIIKERTGAGDSFASAMTAALLKGLTLPDALRWGSANSQHVIQFIGPQSGLLTAAEMKSHLRKFAKIKPKLIHSLK